jgi:hypothetical protein
LIDRLAQWASFDQGQYNEHDRFRAVVVAILAARPDRVGELILVDLCAGGTVGDQWQKLSLQAGAFGLISAVGLGSLENARRIRESKRRDAIARERLDRRLALEEWNGANRWQFERPRNGSVNSAAESTALELMQQELKLVGEYR